MGTVYCVESLTVPEVRKVLVGMGEYVPYEFFDGQRASNKNATSFVSQRFAVPPWHGEWAKLSASRDRDEYYMDFCKNLRKQAVKPETHIQGIEALLAPLISCQVYVYGKDPGSFEDEFANNDHQILKRLPSRPLDLVGLPGNLDHRFFAHDQDLLKDKLMETLGSESWSSLQISACLSVNIIRMALYGVVAGLDVFARTIEDYPDLLAELLEVSSSLASHSRSNAEQQQWYLVRASLWCSWQRSLMLYGYFNLRRALEDGFTSWERSLTKFRRTTPSPGQSIQQLSSLYAAHGKARAMCSWAFELLRTESICLGMDFRTFHQRYSQLWGDSPARCQKGSPLSCAGDTPGDCWRFTGMVIEDQSAHDTGCSRQCPKVQWDKFSYMSASGARAVPVKSGFLSGNQHRLEYCQASERTMAISHVWSHGQGGRPDDGVNFCLHVRYVEVARRLGCDSHWWDSACIPEDHDLRSEAIQNINRTFSSSAVVLVCDRDLMMIDISDLTMQTKESILATVLVCDWNLRAWTFLESLRGRHSIYLLCKDNATISFRDIVQDITYYGSIDLAIISLTVPHMLPESDRRLDSYSREDVGQVLSYRPASRAGDDIVIWSLLVDGRAYDSPEILWGSHISIAAEFVHTGFLMSSAPRSNTRYFSWAPSTPYFQPRTKQLNTKASSFRAYDGLDTMPGSITDKGLLAPWHTHEFEVSSLDPSGREKHGSEDSQIALLKDVSILYLQDSLWGALFIPVSNISTFERDRDTRTRYDGLIMGTLVAVLGCDRPSMPSKKAAGDRRWTWKGVYDWNGNIPLPALKEE